MFSKKKKNEELVLEGFRFGFQKKLADNIY